MLNNKDLFFKKKILIYGVGKSGLSVYKFLKKDNKLYLYDDKKTDQKNKKELLNYKKLIKKKIDYIIISPGININKCDLSKYLKKNIKKIYTDLDIFLANIAKIKVLPLQVLMVNQRLLKYCMKFLKNKKLMFD
jgi:UDP-N-acetylmuramoylalanine--D-glutamate ligase